MNISLEDERQRYAKGLLETRVARNSFALNGSLKKQIQRSILKKKVRFVLASLKLDENPFLRISNSMKKELIELEADIQKEATKEENFEDAELQCLVLELLLNKKITSFHFPPGLNLFHEEIVTDLWQNLLAEQPPDLHTIVCKCTNRDRWNVRPFFYCLLPGFPNLLELRLYNLQCTNQDLSNIADNLSNLRILEVDMLDDTLVSIEGLVALRGLKSLQEFLFHDVSERHVWIRMCLKVLPHLHAIAYNLTISDATNLDKMLDVGDAVSQINTPCTLQLRQLVVYDFDQLPGRVYLPELQLLYIDSLTSKSKEAVHNWFTQIALPNLSKLYLMYTYLSNLKVILPLLGQQLQVLHTNLHEEMQLDALLKACPNLSELKIYVHDEVEVTPPLRPDTLQHLQTLTLVIYPDYLKEPVKLLLQIVKMAPALKRIKLHLPMFDDDNFKEWTALAEESTSMQNLQQIALRFDVESNPCSKRLVDLLVATCVINCPQLHTVSVVYNYKRCGSNLLTIF